MSRALDTPRPRRELPIAASLCLLFALAFLWTPIRRLGRETLTTADGLQRSPLGCIDPSWEPGRPEALDVAVRHQAALALERAHMARAELPTWDRCAGFGAPLLAHPDSAPTSPFTWLFVFLRLDLAALLAALATSFLAGLLTYLYLRELRLAPVACLFGASAFQFSGTLIEHLQRPASAIALALPLGLLVLEQVAKRIESGRTRTRPGRRLDHPRQSVAIFALVLFGSGGGNPSAFVFVALVLAAYALLRASITRAPELDPRRQSAPVRRATWQLGACAVLGAGAAGFVLVPLAEYASQCDALANRAVLGPETLAFDAWTTLAFPRLLSGWDGSGATSAGTFFGLTALLLAVLAPFVARARRAAAFFALAAGTFALCGWDVLGLSTLVDSVPGLRLVSFSHGLLVFHFSLAVCAAFVVHHVVKRGSRPDLLAAGVTILVAIVVLFVVRAGAADSVLEAWRTAGSEAPRAALLSSSNAEITRVTAWFALGVACLAAAWIARAGRPRLLAAAGLTIAALAGSAGILRDLHTTTPNTLVAPGPRELKALAELARTKRVVIFGHTPLPGRFGSLHGIESLANGDGIGLARVERLRRTLFAGSDDGSDLCWASRRGLALFGIERLLERESWIQVDTLTGFATPDPSREYATHPIVPDLQVELDFRLPDERTSAIRVCFATGGRPLLQNIELEVVDATTNERVALRVLAPDFERPNQDERVFASVPLPRLPDRDSRALRLLVRSNDGTTATAWSLVAREDWDDVVNRGAWKREGAHVVPHDLEHPLTTCLASRQGGQRLRGQIVFDLTWNADLFRESGAIGPYRVLELVDAVPPYHVVSTAWAAADPEDAFACVQKAAFDPSREVVIEGLDPAGVAPTDLDPPGTVVVVARQDVTTRLTATLTRPGWLVAAEPWVAGRRARVNGVETPVHRANAAFCAVRLPAGASDVVLEYEPTSVRIGILLSALATLAAAAWLLASRADSGLSHDA